MNPKTKLIRKYVLAKLTERIMQMQPMWSKIDWPDSAWREEETRRAIVGALGVPADLIYGKHTNRP